VTVSQLGNVLTQRLESVSQSYNFRYARLDLWLDHYWMMRAH